MRTSMRATGSLMAALLIGCAFFAVGASAGKTSNVTQNITVTSYLANNAAGSSTYDIQGDGLNVLSNSSLSAYYDGVDNVTSILNANTYNHMPVGDWQLTMLQSTVRTVRIDLTGQGLNGAIAPAGVGGAMPARLIEDCTKISLDITQMMAGQTIQCPAWFRLNTSNSNLYYGLSMNPGTDPGSTNVSISCVSNGGNGFCHYWTVDPPAGGPAVGELEQLLTSRGKTTTTLLGAFNLTFHFEIDETRQNP
jgi:hypothetical protein